MNFSHPLQISYSPLDTFLTTRLDARDDPGLWYLNSTIVRRADPLKEVVTSRRVYPPSFRTFSYSCLCASSLPHLSCPSVLVPRDRSRTSPTLRVLKGPLLYHFSSVVPLVFLYPLPTMTLSLSLTPPCLGHQVSILQRELL